MRMSNQVNRLLVVVIIIVVTVLFLVSLNQRLPYQGNLMASDVCLTFESSTYLYNWLNAGIFNLKARMLKTQVSIEAPEGGTPYASYPPGFLIFPYLLALIINNEGTVPFVQGYNLFNHWLTACLFSLIVYFIFNRTKSIKPVTGAMISIFAGAVVIFVPGMF